MHPDLHIHVAGDPALDFVNTVAGHRAGEAQDRLESYEDLLVWACSDELISADAARDLAEAARVNPQAAAAVVEQAKRLREDLHGLFEALGSRRAPDPGRLKAVNAAIGAALAHAEIAPADEGFAWRWSGAGEHLDAPLWPVAKAAGELLASGGYGRMKECANDACGWLFLDLSKNRSRRWCDMRGCGNRSKVRRHRAAKRAQPG
jgi:predicted RNA-binding Zn ribbon-like protein